MVLDSDTFLVALYTTVDDSFTSDLSGCKPRRPGAKPQFADSEVLTLAIWAQWLHCSERALLRWVRANYQAYFPHLPCQSTFNRRARDLAGVLAHLVPAIAKSIGAYLTPYQVFDGLPVPLACRCRGQYHRLFADEAAIGKGGSDRQWYFGCQLLLAVSAEGAITGFILAPANCEGHWQAEALLCWRQDPHAQPWGADDLPPSHRRGGGYRGPTGPLWPRDGAGEASAVPYVVDDGYRGRLWASHWREDYGALVLTPQAYEGPDAKAARQRHARWRQIVEQVNERLEGFLGLWFPQAKTRWGLLTRVAAKLVAFNLGLLLCRKFDQPGLAFATLFSC